MAAKFSKSQHLVFACGRYEGIDDRVRQYYEAKNYRVHEVSIGDYVLGGGEVASLVMIEAITRLIPGVLGNPESLAEESHNEEGYLEYPNFTKPSIWRDLEVPAVLLSGNHGEIAKWRANQAVERAKKNL
jgi:tRNA (guanine37-N1)-methyltransferase